MGLNNFYFIIQFTILFLVLLILQIIRSRKRPGTICRIQIFVLLVYSYFFVATVDWRFLFSIALVTIVSYGCGRLIEGEKLSEGKSKTNGKTRIIAIMGGSVLILVLAYFKYSNFFIESINAALGLNYDMLKIALPVGISFFTFSALSYVIDVYRDACEAEKNIVDFCLYIAFFPKITAGPIVRWTDFKPQVKEYKGLSLDAFCIGIQIFMFGLFKKMVLADHLGVFVDDVFRVPYAYNTGTIALSAISYSLQIYLDFSGYSDMAIGLAKILGFEIKPNFNLPYIARGFSDFWGRWHISLSQWFRDYLYIPLGGNKKGEIRTYINLIVVMLVSGLWHGAGWTFILWGLLHGIASCITRFIKIHKSKMQESPALRVFETMITFIVVTLFWTIFRADSIAKAGLYLKALFTIHSGINQPYTWTFVSVICVTVATIIAARRAQRVSKGMFVIDGFYPILDLSKLWSLIFFFTFCGLTILLGYYGNTAFIYGAF